MSVLNLSYILPLRVIYFTELIVLMPRECFILAQERDPDEMRLQRSKQRDQFDLPSFIVPFLTVLSAQ